MPQIFGKVSRALPTYSADGTQVQQRVTGYGDIVTTQLGDNHSALADEGSYYKATNAAIGTGTSVTVPLTYTAASPTFIITNNSAASGGTRLFIDYVRLFVSSVGGTNTSAGSPQSIQCAVFLDDHTSGTRWASGGSAAGVNIVNVNSSSSVASSASMYFGSSLVANTPGNPRQIIRTVFKSHPAAPTVNATPVVQGDIYSMDFGEHSSSSGALSGASASIYSSSVSPAVIGGGHCLLFYMWYAGHTAITPTYEFEVGWWER